MLYSLAAAFVQRRAACSTVHICRVKKHGTYLRGKIVSRSFYIDRNGDISGGYNITEVMHLCKAGYFLYSDQSMVAIGDADVSGYSGGNRKENGEWQIEDRGGAYILILSFNTGTTKEYSLAWGEENKLFLNGYHYYRNWEGDDAPDCFK